MKARFLSLLAVVLCLVSCQRDADDLNVAMGGEQDVMLTVSLPEATRASSASDALTNGVLSTHNLRYILEIYRVDGENVVDNTCQRFVETSKNTSMVFPVRLAPGYDYRIVAWTDIVEGDSKEDRYYYTEEGLDNVVIKDNGTVNWNAMDETRDAYTAVKVVDDFSSTSNLDMTLTRPFAKVRVVATDITDISKVGLEPTTATVTYSQNMYFKYNAVADVENKGVAEDAKAKSHTYTYAQTATKYDDATGEFTLFTDYIFVPESRTAKFELTVKDQNGGEIKYNHFNTEIFVERNKLTTIKGDVLTTGGNIKVTVDNELGVKETYTYVDTAEDLQDKINNATNGEETNISLGGNIDLNDLLSIGTLSTRAAATLPIVIPENKTIVLDLNGFTITTPWEDESAKKHYYAFTNNGTLTIKDSSEGKTGKIIARGNFNYGTLTLESGTIDACDANGGYAVKNEPNATFVMNGGSVVTSYEDGDAPTKGYDATTIRNDAGATATFNGGVVNNISNYTFALDNAGTVTVNAGTFTSVHSTVSTYGTMTINGGTFTCDGLEGITAHALVAWDGSNTTINGGTFDGKDNYNGFNIDADKGAVVNIYGGNFLPVHSDSLYGEGTINVMGGTFFDDPSARVADGYKAEKANGVWTVAVDPVAKIGETEYATLEDAVAAAEAGNTITVLRDATLSAALTMPAGVTLNGNGKQINGTINAGGDLTFAGHTKVTSFSASYYDRVITIGEGACLEVTGGGRVSLAYGNTFNITGSIEDAKTADKAEISPSLIIPAGISITGGNNATMNVTNAYVQIGSTTSKPGAAGGLFTFNFNNSIAEFTKEFGFYDPTGGVNPTFVMNIENSVFTTGTKLYVTANSEVKVDNSVVTLGTYFRNSGKFDVVNGSVLTGATIQFGENGGNDGALTVDASVVTINASAAGHALDGKGAGSITLTNGAEATVTYYQGITVNTDATSTFTGTEVE